MTERPANVIPFRPAAAGSSSTWFSMVAATEGAPARVDIYDEIGAWGISAKSFIDGLRALDGEGLEVEIHINSPGGEVFDGIAMAAAVASMKAKTIGVCDGLAASMASIIFVACDERRMPENAFVMIHNPSTIAWGEAKDLRASADTLDAIRGQMIRTYAKATGQSEDDIGEMCDAATWMNSLEATALGYNHVVLEAVKAAACIRADALDRLGEIPAEAQELVVAEAEEVTASAGEEVEVAGEAAPVEDPSALSAEEQNKIIAACSAFEMPEKAAGFIEARAQIADVRASLWNASAEADQATQTDPAILPVETNVIGTPNPLNAIRAKALRAVQGIK